MNINLNNVQETLVSGTNIKTINGEPILGSGDLSIGGGGALPFNGVAGTAEGTISGSTLRGSGISPVELISAPGTGKYLVPTRIRYFFNVVNLSVPSIIGPLGPVLLFIDSSNYYAQYFSTYSEKGFVDQPVFYSWTRWSGSPNLLISDDANGAITNGYHLDNSSLRLRVIDEYGNYYIDDLGDTWDVTLDYSIEYIIYQP